MGSNPVAVTVISLGETEIKIQNLLFNKFSTAQNHNQGKNVL